MATTLEDKQNNGVPVTSFNSTLVSGDSSADSNALGKNSLDYEQNPFEESFAPGSVTQKSSHNTSITSPILTPGGRKLPPLILSPNAPSSWSASGFPRTGLTPNESGLRTGLTPGGNGFNGSLGGIAIHGINTPNSLAFPNFTPGLSSLLGANNDQHIQNAQRHINESNNEHATVSAAEKAAVAASAAAASAARNMSSDSISNSTITNISTANSTTQLHNDALNAEHNGQGGGVVVGSANSANSAITASAPSSASSLANNNTAAGASASAASTASAKKKARKKTKKEASEPRSKKIKLSEDNSPQSTKQTKKSGGDGGNDDDEVKKEEGGGGDDDEGLTEEEKRKQFLERNRVAASKCRQRKKQQLVKMENDLNFYLTEYNNLTSSIDQLKEQSMILRAQLINNKIASPELVNPLEKILQIINQTNYVSRMRGNNPSNLIPTVQPINPVLVQQNQQIAAMNAAVSAAGVAPVVPQQQPNNGAGLTMVQAPNMMVPVQPQGANAAGNGLS